MYKSDSQNTQNIKMVLLLKSLRNIDLKSNLIKIIRKEKSYRSRNTSKVGSKTTFFLSLVRKSTVLGVWIGGAGTCMAKNIIIL